MINCICTCTHAREIKVNSILPYDESLLNINISLNELKVIAERFSSAGEVTGLNEAAWAFRALTLTDLTTLSGDDTAANVTRLAMRAAYPFPLEYLEENLDIQLVPKIHTAAICVYPARVKDALDALIQLDMQDKINIAAVATGFPTGQFALNTRLREIYDAIEAGATEIDIVINRQMAIVGDWEGVYNEVVAMRKTCGEKAHLKTILAIGELGSMENVYKAAMVCMLAGADFIKTSTGKEVVNATLPVGLCMIYAIKEFMSRSKQMVGLKPAGGVRTVREAISWMIMVKETLGIEWLRPEWFRFGASGLLDDIQRVIYTNLRQGDSETSSDTDPF